MEETFNLTAKIFILNIFQLNPDGVICKNCCDNLLGYDHFITDLKAKHASKLSSSSEISIIDITEENDYGGTPSGTTKKTAFVDQIAKVNQTPPVPERNISDFTQMRPNIKREKSISIDVEESNDSYSDSDRSMASCSSKRLKLTPPGLYTENAAQTEQITSLFNNVIKLCPHNFPSC